LVVERSTTDDKENLMTTTPAPEPTEPTTTTEPVADAPQPTKPATRRPRTPAKSGDPRADRAAAKKAAAPKDEWTKLPTFKEPLAHSAAHIAYRKQRTLLHGAGPEAYRKAAAKALGITDAAFEAAFYLPKAQPEGK
jgi:hypothetical protein